MKKNIKINNYLKNFILAIMAMLVYFVLPQIEVLPFQIFNVDTTDIPNIAKLIYLTAFDALLMALILLIFNKKLIADFKDIKKNHKEYFSKNLKYWLIGLAVMVISNVIISFGLGQDVSSNEETIREMFKINPIFVYFSAVIFAPIVEELIFRQGIKYIIPNEKLFILISGLIFGGLHVVTSFSSPVELLYLIPYCSLGFAFAYIFAKTKNIFVTIGIHMMHNGLLIALQFIVLIFS